MATIGAFHLQYGWCWAAQKPAWGFLWTPCSASNTTEGLYSFPLCMNHFVQAPSIWSRQQWSSANLTLDCCLLTAGGRTMPHADHMRAIGCQVLMRCQKRAWLESALWQPHYQQGKLLQQSVSGSSNSSSERSFACRISSRACQGAICSLSPALQLGDRRSF